tara:strand:+ start:57 stop:254 length:198 start_codon:yes stop_codon:yes gene_type:complete
MPNFTFKEEKKIMTRGNKDREDSYFDTFEAGNLNEDPFAPTKLGGTTNVIRRLLGMDYKKKKRRN